MLLTKGYTCVSVAAPNLTCAQMTTDGATAGEEGALGLVLAHRDRNEMANHDAPKLGSYAGIEGRSSSIWSTSHHLQAAAEASAEISVAIKVQQSKPSSCGFCTSFRATAGHTVKCALLLYPKHCVLLNSQLQRRQNRTMRQRTMPDIALRHCNKIPRQRLWCCRRLSRKSSPLLGLRSHRARAWTEPQRTSNLP